MSEAWCVSVVISSFTDITRFKVDALPDILQRCASKGQNVAVVACHACAHLSKQIIEICCDHKVDFAVGGCFCFVVEALYQINLFSCKCR